MLTLCVRLLLAATAGLVVGSERELRAQAAGIRTHALVAVGAALFTVAGAYGFADVPHGPNVDPARIAAQVASGVGFLGAGAILRKGLGVRGLNTAATLWLAAALGVAAGAGAYAAAGLGTGVVLLVLIALRIVTPLLLRMASSTTVLEIEYERGHGTIGPLLRSLTDAHGIIEHLEVEDDDENGMRHVEVRLRARPSNGVQTAIERVEQRPEVHTVRLLSAASISEEAVS
jgi:putative Mg2+ transporter-C (MgtC) family protein